MSDDLNPDARRLVDLARQARTPGEADKLRIAERLALPLAAGAAIGGATAAAKAAGAQAVGASFFGSLGVKVVALVAVGVAATALAVSQGRKPTGAVAPPVAPPSPHVVVAPVAPAEAAPAPEVAPEVPSEPATPLKAVVPPASHSAKPADDLMEEAALLHRAQTAWRNGQSAEALKLANLHAQRFPRSQLASERDVLRVLSLCKLGQKSAAQQVGARLLKSAKGSPWYQSVADSCAAP